MNKIREYYKTANLYLREYSNFRQLKLQLQNGKWFIYPKRIRGIDQLRRVLVRYAPLNAYFTTSCWLNPLNIEKREGRYLIKDHCYLFQDWYIDIDNRDSIEQARYDAIYMVREMERMGFEFKYALYTGGKGFHLYFKKPEHLNINYENPYTRRDMNKLIRALLFMKYKDKVVSLDFEVCIDPYRITRVEGSWNGNADKPTVCITKEDLSTGSFLSGRFAEKGGDEKYLTAKYRKDGRAVVMPPSFFRYKAIKNCVYGKKDACYVSIIYKNKDLFKILKNLNVLSKYGIDKAYIIEFENYLQVLSENYFSSRRMEKILKAVKADNINTFRKFKITLLRSSPIYDKEWNEIYPKPKLLMEIEYRNRHIGTDIIRNYIDNIITVNDYVDLKSIEVINEAIN